MTNYYENILPEPDANVAQALENNMMSYIDTVSPSDVEDIIACIKEQSDMFLELYSMEGNLTDVFSKSLDTIKDNCQSFQALRYDKTHAINGIKDEIPAIVIELSKIVAHTVEEEND